MIRTFKTMLFLILFLGMSNLAKSQPWVREFSVTAGEALQAGSRVVKAVVVNQNKYSLYSHTGNNYSIIRTDFSGNIINTWNYRNLTVTNMTVVTNAIGAQELFIVGINQNATGQIRRINPATGAVIITRDISPTNLIIDAEQCHTTTNRNRVVLLGRANGVILMSYDLVNNIIASSVLVNNVTNNNSSIGYGLAVSQLADFIIVGTSNYSNLIMSRYGFDVGGNLVHVDINTGVAGAIIAGGGFAPVTTLELTPSGTGTRVVDAMASIPNSDNVIFSYHETDGITASNIGILNRNQGQNTYNLVLNDQNLSHFGRGRRIFDISVNDNGSEVCVGAYNTTTTSTLFSSENGQIAFNRFQLQNFNFITNGIKIYQNYQQCRTINYPALSTAVSVFAGNTLLSDICAFSNTIPRYLYAFHPQIDEPNTCFTSVLKVDLTKTNTIATGTRTRGGYNATATVVSNNLMTNSASTNNICGACQVQNRSETILTGWINTSRKFEGAVRVFGQVRFGGQITIDFTNCDVVFDDCSSLTLDSGALLRANNSVFRTCNEDVWWAGLILGSNRPHEINECLFKNAINAVHLKNAVNNVSIISSTFKNTFRGILIDGIYNLTGSISSNVFLAQRPTTAINYFCNNNFQDLSYNGIRVLNSNVASIISDNTFENQNPISPMIGIFANNAGIQSVNNKFIANRHGIHIEGSNVNGIRRSLRIIGNEFNALRQDNVSHQINIGNLSSLISINKNRILGEFNERNQTSQVNGINGLGASGAKLTNIYVIDNLIKGFTNGIKLRNVAVSNIIENEIENCNQSGIIIENGEALTVNCNKIDLNFGNGYNQNIGIDLLNIDANSKINSNCISNTTRGVHIQNNFGFNIILPLPQIRNNFFYNYTTAAIDIVNYQGSIGSSSRPGLNTFYTNYLNSSDIMASSNVTIDCYNNYIPFHRVGPNVIVRTNSFSHSSAACAKQILDRSVQYNLDNEILCKSFDPTTYNTTTLNSGSGVVISEKLPNDIILSEHGMLSLVYLLGSRLNVNNGNDNYANIIAFQDFLNDPSVSRLNDLKDLLSSELYELFLDDLNNSPSSRNASLANRDPQIAQYQIFEGPTVDRVFNVPTGKYLIELPSPELVPVPAATKTTLSCLNTSGELLRFDVFDMTGKLISSFSTQDATVRIDIDVSNMKNGCYVVKANRDFKPVKFVVVH